MDLWLWSSEILGYITIAMMFCAELRESQATGSAGPIVESLLWWLVVISS
jgi:hypothetical protein